MKNYDITKANQKEAAAQLQKAMAAGNEEEIQKAWENFAEAVKVAVKEEVEAETTETATTQALATRGVRMLTPDEKKFWNAFIDASKSGDFKNAINNIDVAFPETIIEDVFKEIQNTHPLLETITFQNVSVLTKWILSDHSTQSAVWGDINGEITKEIEGALKKIDLTMGKLSAFAIIPLDMLELGPVFVDSYIRALLVEAIALGLEHGIVKGKGRQGEPIGLVRDIHEGVSVSDTDGYPLKTAKPVKSFDPVNYGALCAELAESEKGNPRIVPEVSLICNQKDYFKKIMPATTVLAPDGTYRNNIFPHPTKVIVSNSLSEGEAVLFLPKEYFFGLGNDKKGVLSYSDEFKFLEDARTYKIKMHGFGRAYDNTCALLLDISDLEPVYLPVTVHGGTVTTS